MKKRTLQKPIWLALRTCSLALFLACVLMGGIHAISLAKPCAEMQQPSLQKDHASSVDVSENAKHLVEWLATRTFAAKFCGQMLDPAEEQHRASILKGEERLQKLYDDYLEFLENRCIYDPEQYCQDMGFGRKE